MYNLTKNNYHLKPKNSTIYTPKEVSEFIFELLRPHFYQEYDYDHQKAFQKSSLILDPCSGQGSLLAPWKKVGYETWGIDKDETSSADIKFDFLKTEKWERGWKKSPTLVLCNPPFNGYGQKLGSEVWLDKIIELFGKEIPLVLFVPMGFRLNGKKSGKRWTKFTNQKYPAISSIISLPRDIFPEVEFHSEILIFNISGLQPHYFYQPNE